VTIQRASGYALLVALGAIQLSNFAGQTLLGLAGLGWLATLARDPSARRLQTPAFFAPLIVYAALTLVATVFSRNPSVSFADNKELLLLLVVPLTMALLRGEDARRALDFLISVGAVVAIVGVYQYGLLEYSEQGQRPAGTLSHYMTYSGVLMLLVCATAARLLFEPGRRIWPALIMPALVVSLVATLSRNAWLGALAGLTVLFLLRDLRLIALLPVLAAAVLLVAPSRVVDRVYSIFDLKDLSNRDRIAMARAGLSMINDDPLTGVGPDMVPHVYPQYRTDDAVDRDVAHLHNVPLHIAAERGLPALLAWLVFVGIASRDLFRLARTERSAVATAGLASLVAMATAGLFEYNFGDSEFLVPFLALITLPFARRAGDGDGLTQGTPVA
jgi:O-antigen ligase